MSVGDSLQELGALVSFTIAVDTCHSWTCSGSRLHTAEVGSFTIYFRCLLEWRSSRSPEFEPWLEVLGRARSRGVPPSLPGVLHPTSATTAHLLHKPSTYPRAAHSRPKCSCNSPAYRRDSHGSCLDRAGTLCVLEQC